MAKPKQLKHEIVTVESDRDRVRLRPTIYTSSTGADGCRQVLGEAIDNALDELSAQNSVGDTVTVTFDNVTKEYIVEDNGGGIPHDGMLRAVSVLSSSGKYENGEESHYLMSSGINGYGAKLGTFLSDYAEYESIQNGESLKYRFEDGLLTDTKKSKAKGHGTKIKVLLSKRFLDIGHLEFSDIKRDYEEKSYLFPNIHMNLIHVNKGKEVKKFSYFGKDILDRVEQWKPDTEVIRVKSKQVKQVLKNLDDDKLTDCVILVDLAFGYKEDVLDAANKNDFIISYANSVHTYSGGTHVDGFYDGLVKYFRQQVIPNLKGKDKDLAIIPTDIISGACAFITVKLINPTFEAQFKSRIINPEVKFAVRDAVYEALCNEKPATIKQIVDFVKRVTRGRMASKKTRKKDISNAFSKDRIDKFKDINYNLRTTCPELVLVEGDSASDNAATARDANNQAIYGIARPANLLDMDSEQVEKIKGTFNNVLDICGIQPGKKCDPEKSTMRYILIMTDGDVDGDSICNSVVCLLAKHCKPMIDAGMVGRILPPAYSIPAGKGKKVYVRSQREFFDKVLKKFLDDTEVTYKGRKLSKKELRLLVEKNFDYDTELDHLAERNCCSSKLMEYIAWHYHGHNKDQKKSYWMTKLKPFSGISVLIENGMIILDGEPKGQDYINIAFDEYFDRHVYRFKKYQQNNVSIDGYTIDGKPDKTLYDVMHLMRTYIPKGVERFKGLGELDKDEMKTLCMDPKTRTVVIFKFKDFENDLEKINVIMSTKKMYAQARQQLILQTRLSDLDLDT